MGARDSSTKILYALGLCLYGGLMAWIGLKVYRAWYLGMVGGGLEEYYEALQPLRIAGFASVAALTGALASARLRGGPPRPKRAPSQKEDPSQPGTASVLDAEGTGAGCGLIALARRREGLARVLGGHAWRAGRKGTSL